MLGKTPAVCCCYSDQSYVITDGQSASLSWCQALICGTRPDFCYCQTVGGLLTWGAPSDETTGLAFTIAAGPRQRSHSLVRVPRESWPYLTVSFETPPTWMVRFPLFISLRNSVPQLHPQPLGSHFVAFYDWQDCGFAAIVWLYWSYIGSAFGFHANYVMKNR
jgi:hypothetical protein